MKQLFALGRKPAAAKPAAAKPVDTQPAGKRPTRHVPAEVRRQVVARDGMQCTFVSEAGKRCEQRGNLEFHHEHPFGRGGETSVANIRLLCAPHNSLLAERDYGREFIRQRIDDSSRGVRDAAFVWGSSDAPVARTSEATGPLDSHVFRKSACHPCAGQGAQPKAWSLDFEAAQRRHARKAGQIMEDIAVPGVQKPSSPLTGSWCYAHGSGTLRQYGAR